MLGQEEEAQSINGIVSRAAAFKFVRADAGGGGGSSKLKAATGRSLNFISSHRDSTRLDSLPARVLVPSRRVSLPFHLTQ